MTVMTLTITVDNAYSDGHQSQQTHQVVVELDGSGGLDGLWEHLYEYTGDGHGVDDDHGYCHTVTIVDSPDRPGLVGLSNEWVGA